MRLLRANIGYICMFGNVESDGRKCLKLAKFPGRRQSLGNICSKSKVNFKRFVHTFCQWHLTFLLYWGLVPFPWLFRLSLKGFVPFSSTWIASIRSWIETPCSVKHDIFKPNFNPLKERKCSHFCALPWIQTNNQMINYSNNLIRSYPNFVHWPGSKSNHGPHKVASTGSTSTRGKSPISFGKY